MPTTTLDQVLSGLQSFESAGRFRLNATATLSAALEGLPSNSRPGVRDWHLEDRVARVQLFSPSAVAEVRPHDSVEAGLFFEFTREPREGIAITTAFLRPVCMNVAAYAECGVPSSIAVAPNGRHLHQVAATTGRLWRKLEPRVQGLRRLCRPTQVSVLLRDSLRRACLPTSLMPTLARAWQEDEAAPGESSEFAAFNAMTRCATHSRLPAETKAALNRIAGAYALRHEHACSNCLPRLSWRNGAFMQFVHAALQPVDSRPRCS